MQRLKKSLEIAAEERKALEQLQRNEIDKMKSLLSTHQQESVEAAEKLREQKCLADKAAADSTILRAQVEALKQELSRRADEILSK